MEDNLTAYTEDFSMEYKIGDVIEFQLGSRTSSGTLSGIIIEIWDKGRYTVKSDSGFEYYVNAGMIKKVI